MACRVGMTTDLDRRKREHQSDYPTMQNWRILSTHRTKSAAQAAETNAASQGGCTSGHGGAGPEYATWYVYRFEY